MKNEENQRKSKNLHQARTGIGSATKMTSALLRSFSGGATKLHQTRTGIVAAANMKAPRILQSLLGGREPTTDPHGHRIGGQDKIGMPLAQPLWGATNLHQTRFC